MSIELGLLATLVALFASAVTVWLFLRPHVRRVGAAADAILGEEAVSDRSGKEISPARPGLTHRISTVEQTLALLVETNDRLEDHEHRLNVLETATTERLITRAESAQMWRAIAEHAETERSEP